MKVTVPGLVKQLRRCTAVLACFLLLGLLSSASPAVVDTPITAVVTAIREKRFDDALRLSREALKTTPNDTRLWTLEGMANTGLGQPSAALAAYQHALKIAPRYLPALEGAAQTAFQQGDAIAKPLLLRILEQQPDEPTSHAMLGSLAYRAHDCEEAIAHFEKASAALAAQPDALAEYGACLGNTEHFDQAVAVFTQLVAIDSRWSASYNLALSQWKAKHADAALATLQPFIDATPAEEDVLTLAAEIAEEAGDTQKAIELLRKAILDHPATVDAYMQFAFLSGNHASFQVGIDMLSAGMTQMPAEARLYLARGVMYGQLGESEKALNDLEYANKLAPHLSFVNAAEGVLQSQQHKSAEALATFRAAAKAHPADAFTHYLLAEALSGESKEPGSAAYREEITAANRAVQLDPTLVAARDLLAALYLEDGLAAKSIEQSEAALKQDPRDEQALYHLMLALRKTDRKDEVPKLVQRLTELRKEVVLERAQKKQYQIYEIPAGTVTH
jgi:tetratricopeptide (TPR) repeat protein